MRAFGCRSLHRLLLVLEPLGMTSTSLLDYWRILKHRADGNSRR